MAQYLVGLRGYYLVACFLMVNQKAPEMGSKTNLDLHWVLY